jgi:hypothetical protein
LLLVTLSKKIPLYLYTIDYYDDEQNDDNYPECRIIFSLPLRAWFFLLLNVWQLDWNNMNPSARQVTIRKGKSLPIHASYLIYLPS